MIVRIIAKHRRRLVALIYFAVMLLLCVVFFYPPGQGSLTLRFVGVTNFPGQAQLTALFSVTNHSAEALDIAHLVEVKTADWPDPERLTTWLVLPAVGPH